jgi:hypothetical protein
MSQAARQRRQAQCQSLIERGFDSQESVDAGQGDGAGDDTKDTVGLNDDGGGSWPLVLGALLYSAWVSTVLPGHIATKKSKDVSLNGRRSGH